MSTTKHRIQSFDQFKGQVNVISHLRIKAASAKKTGVPLSHMAFFGPKGTGKTTIAQILANELGVHLVKAVAKKTTTEADLLALFRQLTPGCIFFMDEAHALRASVQELLYELLEDFQYRWYNTAEKEPYITEVQPFTFIAATTSAGCLTEPLLSRIPSQHVFIPYSLEEVSDIIDTLTQNLYGLTLDPGISTVLAKLSSGTPRIAGGLVKKLVEMANGLTTATLTARDLNGSTINQMLKLEGVDPYIGLNSMHRQYLMALLREGAPMGRDGLAKIMDMEESTIGNLVEPQLFNEVTLPVFGEKASDTTYLTGSLVKRTSRGRILTEMAVHYLNLCAAMQKLGWFNGEKLVK